MNWRVRADLPTPPDPTMITLCSELELAPFLFEDMAIASYSLLIS